MSKPFLAFHRFVAAYLASDAGRTTPDSVASALLALDPHVCGFESHPNPKRLHEFRELIEEVHIATGVKAADEPPLSFDDTGVWSIAAQLRQRNG